MGCGSGVPSGMRLPAGCCVVTAALGASSTTSFVSLAKKCLATLARRPAATQQAAAAVTASALPALLSARASERSLGKM